MMSSRDAVHLLFTWVMFVFAFSCGHYAANTDLTAFVLLAVCSVILAGETVFSERSARRE